MAYKVKYRLDYCNKEKLNARLDFEIKDYTSTIIHDIVGTQNAFSYKVRNEKPDRSGYFRTLEADINIFEDENFNIDNLLTSDETKIRVKFYIEGQLEFVGFIIPDFFEVSIDKPRVISMVASDRIGTLKNQTLPRETGVQSFRYMLEQSLLKTGLDLTLNSTINFNPIGETGDFLTNTGGLMDRLSSDKGASISCYDIIKSILIVSNSFLLQENGQWHILNKLEYESRATTKDIEQINVGGRRLINPPSSKVGVMAEFGGGLKYPENYDFDSLNSWTEHNGYIATLNNKIIEGYSNGIPIYGGTAKNTNLLNKNGIYLTETNPRRLESGPISVISSNPNRASVTFEVGVTIPQGATTIFHVYARKGNLYKVLTRDGFEDVSVSKLYNKTLNVSKDNESYDLNVAVEISSSFDGIIEDLDGEVTQWKIYTSSLGNFSDDITSFINRMSLSFNAQTEQKGNLFKIEQGVNFTKESEIDTTIFGDFINKGINGYFYDYQRDEQSSIFYKIGSNWEQFGLGWQDQTQTPLTADRLLLHSVRQRAIMFSDAHNIITAVIKGKFSPLDIYSVCGIKYVLVEAQYDFYRNETELRIEEIKYDNTVLKTDYVYSYFGGEDTTSISGVSGVSSGGVSSGGGSPCLIKIDDDGNYYVEENFYSLKDVSAFGKDDLGGGGGNGDGVALTSWIDQITTLTDFNQNTKFIKQSEVVDNLTSNLSNLPLSARQGMILKNFIDNIEVGEGGQVVVDWDSILGKPTEFNPTAHTHVISDVTGLQVALDAKTSKSYVDDGLATKENAFAKNTAFNRNFGTTAGTVSQGNHTHTFASLTSKPTTLAGYGITDGAKSVDVDSHITDKENPHSVTKTQIGLSNVLNVKQATKTEFDTFKNLFDSLFELDGDYIKAKKSLYSTGDLSAFGKDNLGGGGTGGGTDLVSWVDQIMALTDFNVGSNFTTQSDIDSAIDDLEIGGRNLLIGSTDEWKTVNAYSSNLHIPLHFSETKLEAGQTYVFSWETELLSGSPTASTQVTIGAGVTSYLRDILWTGRPIIGKQFRVFTPTETHLALGNSFMLRWFTNNEVFSFRYRKLKLEKGNNPTADWAPALEDQVSDWSTTDVTSFSYIKNKPTKLSQFSNVETDFASKTYVGSNFVDLVNPQTIGGVKTFNQSGISNVTTFRRLISGGGSSFVKFIKDGSPNEWLFGVNTENGDFGAVSEWASASNSLFTLNASTGVISGKSFKVDTGWTLSQVGTELQFKYNGTIKARMTADGHIIANGDVTAFG